MGAAEPRSSRFRAEVERAAENVVLATWLGHMDARALREHCADLESLVHGLEGYVLAIDATGVSGFDPEVHAEARRWASSEPARRARAVAIIADSQLLAAESPAAAMAPPRKARLFGSRRAAMAFVESAAFASSGEYVKVDPPKRATR